MPQKFLRNFIFNFADDQKLYAFAEYLFADATQLYIEIFANPTFSVISGNKIMRIIQISRIIFDRN